MSTDGEKPKRGRYGHARRNPANRGQMNKLEIAYAGHLEGRKMLGEITWYEYEAMRLKLAEKSPSRPALFWSPDFALVTCTGLIELHEIKGFQDAATIAKIKVAADKFPFVFRLVTRRPKKDGGGWILEEF